MKKLKIGSNESINYIDKCLKQCHLFKKYKYGIYKDIKDRPTLVFDKDLMTDQIIALRKVIGEVKLCP